jgi:hypothetical protein
MNAIWGACFDYKDFYEKIFDETIRDRIYDVIVNGGMAAGYINFDTDAGQYQVKDAVFTNAYNITNYEIFNSKLSGIFKECNFYDCTIQNSYISDSNLLIVCNFDKSLYVLIHS